jgi:hypothetical protein
MGQRSEYRMEIVSDRGDSIRAVGSFPEVKVAPGVKINNGLVQSIVTIAPDGRHTAVACMSVDYIDIYDENMELAKRLRGPMDVQPEFMMKELPGSGGMFALTQEPRFFVFVTCASTDKGFFVAYNGIEIKTPEDLQKEATRILSFDWNGKPLRCYTFDHPVWCFDVDAAAEKLYVATQNNESLEPEILIYNL